MPDFRSERSPTPDGQGNAKRRWQQAWDAYVGAVRPTTDSVMRPVVRPLAGVATFDLTGFGSPGTPAAGSRACRTNLGMSRSAIYWRISAFRSMFGEHPDAYRMAGVLIDMDEVVRSTVVEAGEEDDPAGS